MMQASLVAMRQQALLDEHKRSEAMSSRKRGALTPASMAGSAASTPGGPPAIRPRTDAAHVPVPHDFGGETLDEQIEAIHRFLPTPLTPEFQANLLFNALGVPDAQRQAFLTRPVANIGEVIQLLTTFNLAVIQPTLTQAIIRIEAGLTSLENTVIANKREFQWLAKDSRQQQIEFARTQIITHGWSENISGEARHTYVLEALSHVPDLQRHVAWLTHGSPVGPPWPPSRAATRIDLYPTPRVEGDLA